LNDGFLCRRVVGNREVGIVPLTYGRARITIGPAGQPFFDDGW
jgi:hypothetical protein